MLKLGFDTEKKIEQVKASGLLDDNWYRQTYPDIAFLEMDPAEHYLKYGAEMRRDPGPDFCTRFFMDTHPGSWQNSTHPLLRFLLENKGVMTPQERSVLWAAQNVALRGDRLRAVKLAETFLPHELAYTVNILRANAALAEGAETDWLRYLNVYLEHFGIEPICLSGEGTLYDRLSTRPLPPITGGPLISVIMPAWNAEKTVHVAARSILSQTWQNLELLIVDDCSGDGTWGLLQDIAAGDDRVRILRNTVNVGPFVSKNIALTQAKGDWITGHDADDWAHPQRLERHYATGSESRASLTYMLRMKPTGFFEHCTKIGDFSNDGIARIASISCMFERNFIKDTLGFWDSVRFGADSEMIARARAVLGDRFQNIEQIGMICLDHEDSLTNDPEHGIKTKKGLSDVRLNYKESWVEHHSNMTEHSAYLDFFQNPRKYATSMDHAVPEKSLKLLMPGAALL